MKSYGPKSLLPIGKNNILDNQIEVISDNITDYEILLITGFHENKVQSYVKKRKNRSIKLLSNKGYEDTNVIASINIGLQNRSTDNVIILYGDLVLNTDTMRAPFGITSMLIIDSGNYMKPEEVGCIIQDDSVKNLMYDLPNKWAQIAYFYGKELDMLDTFCKESRNRRRFGFEAINEIISSGGEFKSYSPANMKVIDVDCSKDLIAAKKILQ